MHSFSNQKGKGVGNDSVRYDFEIGVDNIGHIEPEKS